MVANTRSNSRSRPAFTRNILSPSRFRTIQVCPMLRRGLADAGYVEGCNVAFVLRWANLSEERLRQSAAELAQLNVAVIIAEGGVGTALAAKAATSFSPSLTDAIDVP
jgi:hypothetical protein